MRRRRRWASPSRASARSSPPPSPPSWRTATREAGMSVEEVHHYKWDVLLAALKAEDYAGLTSKHTEKFFWKILMFIVLYCVWNLRLRRGTSQWDDNKNIFIKLDVLWLPQKERFILRFITQWPCSVYRDHCKRCRIRTPDRYWCMKFFVSMTVKSCSLKGHIFGSFLTLKYVYV